MCKNKKRNNAETMQTFLSRFGMCELLFALILIAISVITNEKTIFFIPVAPMFYNSLLDALVFSAVIVLGVVKFCTLDKESDCYKHCIRYTKMCGIVEVALFIICSVLLGLASSDNNMYNIANVLGSVMLICAVVYSEAINRALSKYGTHVENKEDI